MVENRLLIPPLNIFCITPSRDVQDFCADLFQNHSFKGIVLFACRSAARCHHWPFSRQVTASSRHIDFFLEEITFQTARTREFVGATAGVLMTDQLHIIALVVRIAMQQLLLQFHQVKVVGCSSQHTSPPSSAVFNMMQVCLGERQGS